MRIRRAVPALGVGRSALGRSDRVGASRTVMKRPVSTRLGRRDRPRAKIPQRASESARFEESALVSRHVVYEAGFPPQRSARR